MDPALALLISTTEARQKALREATLRGDSTVAKFYQDSTVFLTGGSGFIGKQLIEKLVRYDTLHKERPNFVEHIVAVEGDVSELKLGLNDGDWRKITEEVNIIFHVAASVQFNEDLANAAITNVRGTREVLCLAREMKQLRSIVHVSTAFSHATTDNIKGKINEEFYEVPVTPETLIELAENKMTERLQEILKKNVGPKWPNTYTFTKAVAEEAVRTMAGGLPVCIVRPAVVIPAYREPSPGWLDLNNIYGASGLIVARLTGVLHSYRCNPDMRADIVPVDVVNNAVVAAGWETASKNEDDLIMIYTVTNTRNPFTFRQVTARLDRRDQSFDTPKTMWYGFVILTESKTIHFILTWFLHYIPAYVVDSLMFLTGRKHRILRIYEKTFSLLSALSYFATNFWSFGDDNTRTLYNKLSSTDKDIFNFEISLVDYIGVVDTWVLGIRKHIIKDGLQGTELGIRKQFWLRILHYIIMTGYAYALKKICTSLFSFVMFVVKLVKLRTIKSKYM